MEPKKKGPMVTKPSTYKLPSHAPMGGVAAGHGGYYQQQHPAGDAGGYYQQPRDAGGYYHQQHPSGGYYQQEHPNHQAYQPYPPPYHFDTAPPSQMFSDENPNACAIF